MDPGGGYAAALVKWDKVMQLLVDDLHFLLVVQGVDHPVAGHCSCLDELG